MEGDGRKDAVYGRTSSSTPSTCLPQKVAMHASLSGLWFVVCGLQSVACATGSDQRAVILQSHLPRAGRVPRRASNISIDLDSTNFLPHHLSHAPPYHPRCYGDQPTPLLRPSLTRRTSTRRALPQTTKDQARAHYRQILQKGAYSLRPQGFDAITQATAVPQCRLASYCPCREGEGVGDSAVRARSPGTSEETK